MIERMLRAREVGELLGLHPETVLVWIRRGELPAVRLPGGAIRIPEHELEEWLEARATSQRGVSTATSDAARSGRLSSVLSTAGNDEE